MSFRSYSLGSVEDAIRLLLPVDARSKFAVYDDPSFGGIVMRCLYCKTDMHLGEIRFLGRDDVLAAIERAVSHHWHRPPKPLTPEEKERVRINMIHKRGALRIK